MKCTYCMCIYKINFELCFHNLFTVQLEEVQSKMQREVVDARHGVNFVMVRKNTIIRFCE